MVVGLATTFEPASKMVAQERSATDGQLAMREVSAPPVLTAVDRAAKAPARTTPTKAAPETEATPATNAKTRRAASSRSRRKKARTSTPRRAAAKADPPSIETSTVAQTSKGSSADPSRPAPRPNKLSTSQLKRALATTKADARRCGPEHGAELGTRVQVKLSIEGITGSVLDASPKGVHEGTSLGRCVALALSRTQFPQFQVARMGTLYSVRL